MMQQLVRDFRRHDVHDDAEAPGRRSPAPKMLIADDDPLVVSLIADRCARIGYAVETASDGVQAFLKASRGKPDILVIDVKMPELDGLSVCEHLLDADQAPVNVIVITGSRDPHTLWRCESFGRYCARKGPNFWSDLEVALANIHPVGWA